MDTAALVKADRIVEAQVLEALARRRIPVTLCEWNYVPGLEEWQLIIATPWYDSKGPLTAYRALVDALEDAGIYQHVPMRRVFLKSPGDSMVKLLQQEARRAEWDGFVHLLRHQRNGNTREYSLVFAPVARDGAAAVKPFPALDGLQSFLLDDLHLSLSQVQEALKEMARTGHSSIYPVTLSTRQVKQFGLA